MIHNNGDNTYTVTLYEAKRPNKNEFEVFDRDRSNNEFCDIGKFGEFNLDKYRNELGDSERLYELKPVKVRVDADFPMKYHQPVFAKTGDGGKEMWTMLIEKAYAKHFGKGEYRNIENGFAAKALEHLTGAVIISHNPIKTKIEYLAKMVKKGCPITVSSLDGVGKKKSGSHPLYKDGTFKTHLLAKKANSYLLNIKLIAYHIRGIDTY